MWIARDIDDTLYLYKKKPKKIITDGIWESEDLNFYELVEPYKWMFPTVKWEDKEPTEVKLVKK